MVTFLSCAMSNDEMHYFYITDVFLNRQDYQTRSRHPASGITLTPLSETVTHAEVPAIGIQAAAGVIAAEI